MSSVLAQPRDQLMPTEKQLEQIADDLAELAVAAPRILVALLVLPFYLVARLWRRARRTD